MFNFYFILIFVVLSTVCIGRQLILDKKKIKNEDGWGVLGFFLAFVALVILSASLIRGLVAHSNQIYENEQLVTIQQNQQIYQEKANNLTQEFAGYLAEKYPAHEKAIFDKISPNGVGIYLVKYPDLKASETIMALVGEIRTLQNDVYKQKLERTKILYKMRCRAKSPWIFQWMMPNIPIPQN